MNSSPQIYIPTKKIKGKQNERVTPQNKNWKNRFQWWWENIGNISGESLHLKFSFEFSELAAEALQFVQMLIGHSIISHHFINLPQELLLARKLNELWIILLQISKHLQDYLRSKNIPQVPNNFHESYCCPCTQDWSTNSKGMKPSQRL